MSATEWNLACTIKARKESKRVMKQFRLITFLIAICFSSLCAFADNGNHKGQDKKTDATEMSMLGLAAASFLGTGSYLVYRRRARSHR